MTSTPQRVPKAGGRSVRTRMMRLITVIILGVFAVMGLGGFFIAQSSGRTAVERTHAGALTNLEELLANRLSSIAIDLRTLSASEAARQFATLSLTDMSGDLEAAQAAMLSVFESTLSNRQGAYMAIRYVTFTGAVWSEATYAGGIVRINDRLRPNELNNDATLIAALSIGSGQVTAGQIGFTVDTDAPAADRLLPYMRFATPVLTSSSAVEIAGVIQIDYAFTPLYSLARTTAISITASNPGRHVVIADDAGRILVDTHDNTVNYLANISTRSPQTLEVDYPALAEQVADRETALSQVGDTIYSAQRLQIGSGGTRYLNLILLDERGVLAAFQTITGITLLLGSLAVGVVLSVLVDMVLRRGLRPLREMETLATRRTHQTSEVPDNEFGRLIHAFETVADEQSRLQVELDQQKGRFSRSLEIAGRIGRETSMLRNTEQLLTRAVNLICDEFGYYHAQVFRIDDANVDAVLIHSRGDVGVEMLRRGYRIPVGSESVIGTVTAKGSLVLVRDAARRDAPFMYEPLLPDTRSELALPLHAGARVIGVLDIQSNKVDDFREEEQRMLQLLADQIAVALENARLIEEAQERIDQIDTLNRQLSSVNWDEANAPTRIEDIYRYDLVKVQRGLGTRPLPSAEIDLSIPITIRGEVIGSLEANAPGGITFTEGDEAIMRAVADRVGIAIENARLFEAQQTSLSETSMLYQLVRALNEANSLEDVLQAIVTSVMPDAISAQIGVFDEYPFGSTPQWMEFLADWSIDSESRDVQMVGIQLHVPDHPLLSEMKPTQVVLVNDVLRDVRMDDVFRAIVETAGGQSLVLIPVTVRGTWRGVMMAQFGEPRQFSEREGRVYSALIDQAGVVIDNRMLLRQNELALEQVERLYTASRNINMAQTSTDLIAAALSGDNEESALWDYTLALFEGDIDSSGWSTRMRVVAYSRNREVRPADELYEITITSDSSLRQREPQIITVSGDTEIDDTPHANNLRNFIRLRGARFGAVFPLFSSNQPIALFIVSSEEARKELTSEDFDVYRAMTGQMSTVLQNRRLLEQTAATLDETRRLYAASRAIAAALDTQTVYESAAQYLNMASAPLTRLSFLTANVPTPTAAFVEYSFIFTRTDAHTSDIDVGMRVPSTLVPFGEMLHQARSVAFNSAADFAQQPALLALLQRSGSRSGVLISIQSRQQWFGAMLIESNQVNAFDEAYLRFAQAVGDQVAIAVESLRLFAEAQQQAQRALALAEAGQLANQIGAEFERSISEVFKRVSEPAAYDRWLLMLYDEELQGLRRVVEFSEATNPAAGVEPEESSAVVPLVDVGIPIMDAYRMGRSLMVNEPTQYPNFPMNYAGLPNFAEYVGKHIAMPVQVGTQIVGVLAVGRGLEAADLDESDEQLARTLAAQVGVAVENRRLFLEAEGERQNLRSILATLPAGVLVLDATTFIPIQFNDQAERLLGQTISTALPFDAATYNLFRTTSKTLYVEEDNPITAAARDRRQTSSDDVMVLRGDKTTYLLVNAAPIEDANGEVSAIVAAFQDISTLRQLESTLNVTLAETVDLYNTTRALTEGATLEALLDQIVGRLATINPPPDNAFVITLEADGLRIARALNSIPEGYALPEEIFLARRTLLVTDVDAYTDLDETARASILTAGIQSFASLPLLARSRSDTPLGWLVAIYSTPEEALLERSGFLENLADNSAVAIDNRNLFRDTQTALQQANNLYRATTTISRVSGTQQLTDALRATIEQLQPDVYAAYLFVNEEGLPELQELFNENMDGAPIDFLRLINAHDLRRVQSLFIDDVRTISEPSPLERDLQQIGTIRSLAVVQMRSKNMPAGCLMIGHHSPRHFDEGVVRYLTTVTDSASVIIDNILLFGQINSTLEETSTLYQASRALSDAATPADILNVVITHLQNRSISTAFVAMLASRDWDTPGAMVRVVASWRNPSEMDDIVDLQGITLTEEQFPAWRLLSVRDVYTVDDVSQATDLDPIEMAGIESIGVQAISFLPLRAGGKPIGTLVLGTRQPEMHQDRDIRIYRSFAEQASLRLEASRLLEQTQRRARQLATSAEVSSYASSLLDLQFLLPRVVDLIKESFEYDHVQIFLMDENDEYAELRASTGEAGRQLLAINHKLARGSASVIGQVTLSGQPTIAADTADARVVHRPNPYLPNTRSEMAIPLTLKGRIVGALDVQSNQPNAFDDDDIAVLRTLAAQISVAIDNAELYEGAQRRASETSFLFNVTSGAAASETLDDALENVANEIQSELDAVTTVIYLPRQYIEGDDPDTTFTQLEPVAVAGGSQPISEITPIRLNSSADSLIAQAALGRRAFILGNLEEDQRYLPIAAESASAIIVPLVAGAQLVGLVVAESAIVNAYDDNVLRTMFTLAGSLSAIVQSQQLLEQVQRQNEQLRELDRLKSDFLANMSHELRTPLNSIIGFSRVILKGIDGPLTEMQEQDLSTIYSSGLHLLNLINDILDQAKIAAGKMDLQFDYFDMKVVIDGVRSIGIGLVKEKPIEIHVNMAPGLPKAYGDEFRTRQVLINLVSNAAKFTRQGTITIDVYPYTHEPTGMQVIRIDVTDTGIGIAEKDLPLLFEAFRQVDSSLTRTQGGTGLGLPIAKSLVEMQGGEMIVRSQVNVGSTFSVLIPLEPTVEMPDKSIKKGTGSLPQTSPLSLTISGDDTEEREHTNGTAEMPDIMPPARPPMLIKRQILLIEDNPDMVDQFRRALQREGFDIFAASIPLEAEAMASGLHPTLIVMDVNFAAGQGWQILERLQGRDDTRDIPVVVVTLSPDRDGIMAAGAFTYVARPFMPEQIVEAVQNAEREARIDKILIIDDQPESVRVLEDLLHEQGAYKVFSAPSAMDGISQVARRRPDLVILDLRMPEMDGFQVIKELRANPETATIPIIVVTGDVLNDDERTQLANVAVLYKADINAGQRRQFMDDVKDHLARDGSK